MYNFVYSRDWCIYKGCQYFMSIDGEVQIEKENLLQILIEKNRYSGLSVNEHDQRNNTWFLDNS